MKKIYLGAAFASLLVSAPALAQQALPVIGNVGPFNQQQVLGVAGGAGFVGAHSYANTQTQGVGSVGIAANGVQVYGQGAGTVNTCATCTGQQGGPGQVTGSALGQASGQQVTAATSIGNSSSTPTSASANAHLSGFGAGIGGGFIGRR